MFAEFVDQNIWLFAAFFTIATLLIFSYTMAGVKGASFVSVLEMPSLQRKGKSVIIDVNKAEHYAAGHIPKSVNFPLEDLSADDSALMKHKDKTTILVCQTGSRSSTAAKKLVEMGFTNLHILRGGIISWTKENMPIASTKN
jgi:rhodanese-related sulfurtransferase